MKQLIMYHILLISYPCNHILCPFTFKIPLRTFRHEFLQCIHIIILNRLPYSRSADGFFTISFSWNDHAYFLFILTNISHSFLIFLVILHYFYSCFSKVFLYFLKVFLYNQTMLTKAKYEREGCRIFILPKDA